MVCGVVGGGLQAQDRLISQLCPPQGLGTPALHYPAASASRIHIKQEVGFVVLLNSSAK